MLWAGNSIGESSTFSSIGWTIELHDMGCLGSIKVSDCPKDADYIPGAFVVFSLLTLGVDIKGSTCPGNLTSEWPVSSHSTKDRISSVLPGRCIHSLFWNGQGTLLTEPGTVLPLDISKCTRTVQWGEW